MALDITIPSSFCRNMTPYDPSQLARFLLSRAVVTAGPLPLYCHEVLESRKKSNIKSHGSPF